MQGNPLYLMQEFMKFRNTFQGNPQQEVQRLLQSGQITQEQYNNAIQQAQQLQMMLNGGQR